MPLVMTKTPFRISLVGGGTDLPAFYTKHGGAVVSFTINKYMTILASKRFDDRIRLSYSETEICEGVDAIQHDLAREALRHMNITQGIEITSHADIPGKGTGIGSSSSYLVGLLNALNQYKILHATTERENMAMDLAEVACDIEINKCLKPIGKQDQYAAAYGGLKMYKFATDGTVHIVDLSKKAKELEKYLLLFYTGITRRSAKILSAQQTAINQDESVVDKMKEMRDLAHEMQDKAVSKWGHYLHWNWELKRSLVPGSISTPGIDRWYDLAIEAGATGGKLLGAGGGGFMLFFAEPDKHEAIKQALPLRHIPFKIDPKGTRIAYMEGFSDE